MPEDKWGQLGTVQGEDPCTGPELGRSMVFEKQWKERWPEQHDQETKGWAGQGLEGQGIQKWEWIPRFCPGLQGKPSG